MIVIFLHLSRNLNLDSSRLPNKYQKENKTKIVFILFFLSITLKDIVMSIAFYSARLFVLRGQYGFIYRICFI